MLLERIALISGCDPYDTDYETCVIEYYVNRKTDLENILSCLEECEINFFLERTINCNYPNGLASCVATNVQDFIESNGGFNIGVDDEGLTAAELALIIQYPSCALKINNNKNQAIQMTFAKFPTGTHHNDCADAFRHAFFNALNTIDCGESIAKEFGDAHESEVPQSQINEKIMDLHNNSIGRSIAVSNPSATESQFANLICQQLEDGVLKIFNSASVLIDSDECDCL
jgi:hypothetical protein